jgi:hypothetical protein
MKDFYYILGVNTNSSLTEIEEAYLKLSQKFQPESNSGDEYFKGRFAEIREAFDTLIDPQKRGAYDLKLARHIGNKLPLRHYHTKRFRRKGPGVGLMLAFIVLVLILGAYFSQYLIASKPVRAGKPIVAVVEAPVHKSRKHRKHYVKDKFAADSAKHRIDLAKTNTIVPAAVKPNPVTIIPVKHIAANSASDSIKTIRKDYLYTAYIHTNVTGIVNMRADDTYGSGVIKTIPANSKVFVLAKGNSYYRVRFNNYTGYVPKWSVESR